MNPSNDNLTGLSALAYREVMAQVRLRGETSACAIFEATRVALDMSEEDCAAEIYDAIFIAVRQGLVACNTSDAADDSIAIGVDTVLAPITATMQ